MITPYGKDLKYWLLLYVLFKVSCNLNGQKSISVVHLKVYVIHEKKTLYSLEVHYFFILDYFYFGHTILKPAIFTPDNSKDVWVRLDMSCYTKPAVLTWHNLFPWLISLCTKCKTIIISFKRHWWSKNPVNLLGESLFWSITYNYGVLNWWKKALFFLEIN